MSIETNSSPLSEKVHDSCIEDCVIDLCLQGIEQDPNLIIRTSEVYLGSIEVRYTDNSPYGKGNNAFLGIGKVPLKTETDIMITQRVERNDDKILTIFIPPNSNTDSFFFPPNFNADAIYYTSESSGYRYRITERTKGGEKRVKDVLQNAEKFLSLYLLSQEYLFRNKKDIPEIPEIIRDHFFIDSGRYDFRVNQMIKNYQRQAYELVRGINNRSLSIESNSSTEDPLTWIESEYHSHKFYDFKQFLKDIERKKPKKQTSTP